MGSDQIAELQSNLLEAAVGDMAFVDVVQKIVDYFGSGGGVIFELNRKTGTITDWVTPNLVYGDGGYDQHINAINPRMHYTLRHAPGLVNYEGRFINERGIDRHEFYDWLDRLSGFRYFLGTRIYDEGDLSIFHSVEFDRNRPHPEPETIKQFGLIARSVGNAWRLSKRTEPKHPDEAPFPWTPDHLPWAIFALAAGGQLLQENSAARGMLESKSFVALKDGVLTAADSRSTQRFDAMIRAGLCGVTSECLLKAHDHLPATAQAVPMYTPGSNRTDRPAVLIYVKDPATLRENAATTLARLFQLSDAERNLVAALTNGSSLADAADSLSISRNTARNQLQSIYGKTGTRRQQELLVRVLGLSDS